MIRYTVTLLYIGGVLWFVVFGKEVVNREDGCPYQFDFGHLGFIYTKPEICKTYMPSYVPASSQPQRIWPPITVSVKLFEGMLDTYKVELQVERKKLKKFRIWDAIIRVNEVLPDGTLGDGVGHFERKSDFKPYCCEKSKRRNLIRFINVKSQRPGYIFCRWAPLKFQGKVKFTANVFDSPTNYYVNVSSMTFTIPFVTEGEDLPYDEDWPDGSPMIPDQ